MADAEELGNPRSQEHGSPAFPRLTGFQGRFDWQARAPSSKRHAFCLRCEKVAQMDDFYAFLRKKGLSEKNLARKIESWSNTETLDFAKEACLLLREQPEKPGTIFRFSASSTLSGAPFPCSSTECRLERLDPLARFAALYADQVYIQNPLERYYFWERIGDENKQIVAGDVLCLLYLRPLFEAGLLSVKNGTVALCEECLAQQVALEEETRERLERPRKRLQERYLKNVEVYVVKRENETFLTCQGPEQLLGHSTVDFMGNLPKPLVEKFAKGEHKVSKRDVRKYGFVDSWVDSIMSDLFRQNIDVYLSRSQYLTDREIDLDVVTSVGEPETIHDCKSLLAGLSHTVPAVQGVRLDRLVRLRQKESEAFEVYRDALGRVLNQARALKPKEMRQLIEDEVRPEVHRIEHAVKNARRLLLESLTRDLIVSTGFIAVGLFGGFLSPRAAEVVTTLGGLNFVRSVAEKVSQVQKDPAGVVEKPYYFLWKLKRQGSVGR
jgi:hypothetical protein